jgi:hypothetical protein
MLRGLTLLVAYTSIFLAATLAIGQFELATSSQPGTAPLALTFQDAVAHAQRTLPQFPSGKTDFGLDHRDRVQARPALLPGVTYNTEYLYTEAIDQRRPVDHSHYLQYLFVHRIDHGDRNRRQEWNSAASCKSTV